MIIGPPGPTGEIVIVFVLPGWTTGDGSGVRKMSPAAPGNDRRTVILGGSRSGREAKCWSFEGCCAGRFSGGCIGARWAIPNEKRRGRRCRTRTTASTRSPWTNGRSGTKLAPRRPE